MSTMVKTTVYLPLELRRQLEEAARREKRSQAAVIREAIRTYLGNEERPPLRSLGIARSRDDTGKTARRWLREHWQPAAVRPE